MSLAQDIRDVDSKIVRLEYDITQDKKNYDNLELKISKLQQDIIKLQKEQIVFNDKNTQRNKEIATLGEKKSKLMADLHKEEEKNIDKGTS